MEQTKPVRAVLAATVGFLLLSVTIALSKGLGKVLPLTEVVFFQFAFCWLGTLPIAWPVGYKTKRPLLHLIRGVAGVFVFLSIYVAVRYIPLVDATLLSTAAPIWIPLILLVLGQKVRGRLFWGILIGFAGVILVLRPGPEIFRIEALVGVLAGILVAVAIIAIRHLTSTEPNRRILFYYSLIGAIVMLPFAIAFWQMPTSNEWLLLVALGAVMLFSQLFINCGLKQGSATLIGPISYTVVLFAGLIGWAYWGDVPDAFSWMGMVLIVAGGVFTLVVEQSR